MCVVLDTDVLLSVLISPHGTADVIYRAWQSAKDERAAILNLNLFFNPCGLEQ
jgi:predicted nucleic acid-binding protein